MSEKEVTPNLIYNAIMTPDGTVLESRHRHDYKTHLDKTNGKEYMVDGGLSYLRRSNNGDEVDLSRDDTAPHNFQRQMLKWGTYGKDGNQPLKFVSIGDMETDHIKAVIAYEEISQVHRACMVKELETRGE